MKRLFTLSVLFTALFTIIATNNTAKAQPESFTKDFVMKSEYIPADGWENEYHTCNVTAVYNASTKKITIHGFFNNPGIPMVEGLLQNFDLTTSAGIWNNDNTIGTFHIPSTCIGQINKQLYPSFSSYSYIWIVSWSQNVNVPDDWNWAGSATAITLVVDLQQETMTLNKWSLRGAQNQYGGGSSKKIVRFNGSSYEVPKTDLVDIVNDGTVGEEYTVNDDLVGVKVVDNVPAEGIEFDDNTTQNTFKIAPGKYKLEVELDNNKKPISLRVSQASPTAELTPWNVDFGENTRVHIFGQVNDYNINYWDPTQGQRMETNDGVHYCAIVNFYDRGDGYSYFSITTDLAQNNDQGGWDYVNGNRYGPSSNNFPISLGKVLFAKDLGKFKNPSVLLDGQDDFMGRVEAKDMYEEKVHPAAEYDQSNWVMLTGLNNPSQFVGNLIKGKSIKGTLVDKINPTLAVSSNPEQGDQYGYEPNLYIMPSFNEAYYSPNSQFFFVAPKVQEYAYITWACYNAADGNFYTMSDGNTSNLTGGIKVNWDYYPAGNPQDGYVYEFDAIIRKVASANGATALKDANQSTPVTSDLSADYLVYPLRLYDVPTAIDAVETTGKVVDVKYYNMMGVESATPFNGVNIEVKTMDNGNRVASKKYF